MQKLFKTIVYFLMIINPYLAYSNYKNDGKVKENSVPHKIDSVIQNLPEIDIEYITLIQGVKHQIPINNWFYKNTYELPYLSQSLSNSITGSIFNFETLFHYSYQTLGASAGGFGPPLLGTIQSDFVKDENDITEFFLKSGMDVYQGNQWEKLPFEFRKGITELLVNIKRAKSIFDQFSKPIKQHLHDKSLNEILNELIIPWEQRELDDFTSIDRIEQADLKKLSFATRIISEKLNWFFSQREIEVPDDFTGCTIKSCLGELRISGVDNDTIEGDHFFVIELGGDDVYLGNTASPLSVDQPFGLVVDLKGNDKYLCGQNYLVAGILGIAVLLDLNGDDFYQTNKPGLGFSLYGSSLIYDHSGDDVYSSGNNYGQAASLVGSALFVDISGNDKYKCQSYSQGFGGTLGVGVFYDHLGDDHYNTDPEITGNNFTQNFIQGAAKGRWAEATDGQSLAGGIGIFIDNSGIDKYTARSFSQGASYYFGLGIFSDNSGDDIYNAISHSQGYAAHYGLACFTDKKGDDIYNISSAKNKITQIIGSGRDFSAGLFIELEGNDTYNFGNRSVGIGDLNGIGFFADFKGDDKYIWNKNSLNSGSPSLGKTIEITQGMNIGFKVFTPRESPSEGVFIDWDGENIFDER